MRHSGLYEFAACEERGYVGPVPCHQFRCRIADCFVNGLTVKSKRDAFVKRDSCQRRDQIKSSWALSACLSCKGRIDLFSLFLGKWSSLKPVELLSKSQPADAGTLYFKLVSQYHWPKADQCERLLFRTVRPHYQIALVYNNARLPQRPPILSNVIKVPALLLIRRPFCCIA